MFCSCPIEFGADPNTHTCPVCLGMPGALPVPNKAAIESIVLAGLATNCDIEKHTMFYRKGYFYPDMAKNFQTTQGPLAFCIRGHLDLELSAKGATERVDVPKDDDGGYTTRIGITRIHMEEDAGKMTHMGGSEGRIDGAERSLVDYNRAGTPLIELVTEPDLRTPEEVDALRAIAARDGREIFFMSADQGEGVEELLAAMWSLRAEMEAHAPLLHYQEMVLEDEEFPDIEVVYTRETD
mgnify:CR=1 FL=1